MPSPSVLLGFVAAALILTLSPGPSVMYVTTRSLDQDRRAGMVSVAGLAVGDLLLVAAAAVGLTALVATSATAFATVKYLGAVYLVWLGIQRLRAKESTDEGTVVKPVQSTRRLFVQGVMVNALNPKSAIFFLAFLPPFVDPSRGPIWAQTLFFGLVFVFVAALTNSGYALAASRLQRLLRDRPWFVGVQRYVTAGVYITLGAVVATTSPQE
jgi:threonine/homoserine/homoserine lactone efflux protein